MKFLSDILARAGLTVDGVVTFNNTATGQTPATNDNSTKLATTAFIKNQSYLTANQTITVSGDATGSGTTSIALTLANSGVTAGTYGNASNIPTIVVDSKGRITSISTNAVSIITTLAGLSDVTLTSPSANQVLQYNGTRWVNGAAPTTYTLPIATASVLGGIKVGDGLSIDSVTGVLSASVGGGNLNFRTIQEFTATAGQTTFTITGGYTPGYIEVLINGVYVSESEYTASNGTTVVLDNAVAHNDIVTVFLYSLYNLGSSNYARNISTLTATAGQTVFNVTYIPGQIDIFYNGSKLTSSEFTATNGTTVTLVQAAVLGDILEVVTYLAGAGVNASRTLTINGVTYDLSADRSWTIPTGTSGSGTTNYLSKWTGSTSLGNSLIFDNGSGIGINTASPFESSAFKLDVNGGVIIKNTSGTAAQLILIDSNPATGGNNGFVQLSAGGNTATAFGQWQTYYGTSIASGTLRLQPAGGVVLVGSSTAVTGAGLLQVAGDVNITGTFRINGTAIALGTTLNGTGLVRMSGTTVSYDNATYATQSYVTTAISNLVNAAPATLDTLNELAAALGNDAAFSTTVTNSIASKQAQLNGTGFVKISGTTISYDNSTYLTTSSASSTYLPLIGGTLTGALGGTSATFSSLVTISSDSGGSALRLIGRAAADASAIRFFTNNNVTQNARIESNSSALEINSISALPITFYTNDTLRLTIASTGAAIFTGRVTAGNSMLLGEVQSSYSILETTSGNGIWLRPAGVTSPNGVFITTNGNLGLGVVPSAWGYSGNIELVGAGRYLTSKADDIRFSSNVYNDGTSEDYASNGFATRYRQVNGIHSWATAPSGVANAAISFTQVMTLNAGGNLGIGVIDPDIFGRGDQRNVGISVAGASDNMALQLNAGGSAGRGAQIYMGQGGTRYFTISSNATETRVGTSTTTPLILVTNDATRLTINGSTGAATFSNSITASGQIISNNAAGVNAVIWARGGADGVGQGKGNFRTSDAGGTNFFDFGRDNLSTGNFVLTSGGGSPLLSITTTGLTTFSGNVNVTVPNTPEVLLTHSNTSRTFLMAVDGTNAFFRANSTANILFQVAGGTNALTLSSTGLATFSVPRTNGTNATSIILSDTLTGVSTPGFGLRIFGYSNGGGVQSAIGFENGGTGTNNESQLSFYTQNIAGGLSQRLLISSTGAAIFSSSVTANGGVYIPNGNYYYAQRNTGSANIGVLGFASGSDTLTIKGGTSGASNSINFEDTGGIIASFFNGRLGIGTTSSPGTKLEVLSVAASADRTLPHNILTLTAEQGNAPYGPFGGAILFKNRSYVSGLVESSRIRSVIYDDGAPNNFGGGLWFETTPTPGGALTPSLIVNYQGRVGINTLNPDYRLQVNSPNAVLKLLSTGASFGSPSINMLQGSIDTVISATNNGLEIGTWSSHPIIFRVGSTGISEAMRITAGGVPGIKTVPTSGWGSAMAAVQVGTGGVLANWTGSNNNFSAGVNFYDNGAGSQLRLYNGGVSKIDFSENEIIFSNAVSNSANTSISFTTRMRLQGNGALSIGRTFGNSYSQTSTSGGTSIVDTGITYDTGDYGGYGRGATYQVVYVGNPNNAGSGAYFAQFVGILMVYTGWSGSAVTTYIQYNQIASGTNIGTLTLTPVFWNGSSETSSIGVYTGGAQIRLKISGYNSSWPGADQSVYLTRLT